MQFSDWQLARLRNAIRAYHAYERSHDGDCFTWKDVSEAIDLYTGTGVPPERLRQFVEGVRKKDGSLKFPVPKGERIKAIYDFATNEEVALISKSELEEFKPSHQALLRLLEYLDQDFDTERIAPPDSIKGTYHMRQSRTAEFIASELVLEKPLENGLIEVFQTDEYFNSELSESFHSLPVAERQKARNSRVTFGGWAILTPEDNFFFFLKNERNARNRYYFTMASDLSHGANEALTELCLLDHDYPLETRFENKVPAQMTEDVINESREKLGVYKKDFTGRGA